MDGPTGSSRVCAACHGRGKEAVLAQSERSGLHILVVDDTEEIIALFRDIIEHGPPHDSVVIFADGSFEWRRSNERTCLKRQRTYEHRAGNAAAPRGEG